MADADIARAAIAKVQDGFSVAVILRRGERIDIWNVNFVESFDEAENVVETFANKTNISPLERVATKDDPLGCWMALGEVVTHGAAADHLYALWGGLRWLFSLWIHRQQKKSPALMLEPERGRMRAVSRW